MLIQNMCDESALLTNIYFWRLHTTIFSSKLMFVSRKSEIKSFYKTSSEFVFFETFIYVGSKLGKINCYIFSSEIAINFWMFIVCISSSITWKFWTLYCDLISWILNGKSCVYLLRIWVWILPTVMGVF